MTDSVARNATTQPHSNRWYCSCGEGILGEKDGTNIIIKSQGCNCIITQPKQLQRLCPKCGRFEPLYK